MLSQAKMSNHLWAKEVNMTCYLVNRSPSIILELKTPYEVWYISPTDYSKLNVFGCPAYAYVKEDKLKPRARKYIFLGYASRVKGYQFLCVDNKSLEVITNLDVTFDEFTMFWKKNELTNIDVEMD